MKSVKDYGPLGQGNDTPTFQAAIDDNRRGGDLVVPSGGYDINDTLVFQDVQCLNFFGEGRTQEVANVVFRWNGPFHGYVFMFDGVRDSRFANFQIKDGSSPFSVGLEYDYFREPQPGMTVPTMCRFEYIQIRNTSGVGARFMARYKGNGELMVFDHVSCIQDVFTPGTVGFQFLSHNAMGHKFFGGGVNLHEYGVHLDGGNFVSYGMNFQQNDVDLQVDNLSGPITLVGTQQENSRMLLRTGATSAPGPITFEGLRSAVAEGLPRGDVAGRYVFYGMGGTLSLRNCSFHSGPGGYDPDWHIQAGVHQGWNDSGIVVSGCHFPGPHPVQYGQNPEPQYPDRDTGLAKAFGVVNTGSDPQGAAVHIPNFERV